MRVNPSVAALRDGGFVVTWKSDEQDRSQGGIYGRRYDANGVPGPEFQINTYTNNDQIGASVAALSLTPTQINPAFA